VQTKSLANADIRRGSPSPSKTSVSIPEARAYSSIKSSCAPSQRLTPWAIIYRPYRPIAFEIPEGGKFWIALPLTPSQGGKPEYPPLEGARGRKKWFAPTSFRNEVSFLNDTASRDGMFIELILQK
jgi:hypothetical protein